MENLRLKSENNKLERKNMELQAQIHDLMTKNNSLNQEILNLKYSNKDEYYKQPANYNNLIIELNKTISDYRAKINQITREKIELMKINNQLKISNNFYMAEKQKHLKKSSSTNNDLLDSKKINDILNKNLINLQNDINNKKNIIQELTEENNNIYKQLNEIKKENELLNEKITDKNKIIEVYKEKCFKISKELNEEKDIISFNDQKIKQLERKLEEINFNEIYDQKTKTYKGTKINKVNEIEMEKLSKRVYSPSYHKNTTTVSSNNTTNKIIYVNNLDEVEISPDKYIIVKQFKLSNNLKWYLLKKIKKQNSDQKEDISPSKSASKRHFRRKYINGNTKINNNIFNDDSYSDFIWKSNKNEKDFVNFNIDIMDDDDNEDIISKQKKINELESCVKELEEKLAKKENDCNRINVNYAKLFKRSKLPEMSYDKLLENVNKLKEDNKNLNKKIENMKINQNFIGFSFIEDDLNGSRFIDDKCFEEILDEISNDKNNNINMMKYFRSHQDEKEYYDKKYKRLKESNSDKKILSHKKMYTNNNEIKNFNLNLEINNKYKIKTAKVSPLKNTITKDNLYKLNKTPSKVNLIKDNNNIVFININKNNNYNNLGKNNYEKREINMNNKKNDNNVLYTISNDKDYNIDRKYVDNKYKLQNRISSGTNSKVNVLVKEGNNNKKDNIYKTSKTITIENSNKNNEIIKRNLYSNQFSIKRREYKKRSENIKSDDIYNEYN